MLAGTSLAGWAVLVLADASPILPRLCSAAGWDAAATGLAAVRMNPLAPLLIAYLAMLAAMMAPLLILPLREVSDRAVPGARTGATALFAAGYGLPWLAAAPLFALAVLWLQTGQLAATAWGLAVPLIAVLGWHLAPLRQRALNRCHRRQTGFVGHDGGQAGVVRAGLGQGGACLAACAPLMLWAMAQQGWHLPAMALVAGFVWTERRLPPEVPGWGWSNLHRTGARFGSLARQYRRRLDLSRGLRAVGHG